MELGSPSKLIQVVGRIVFLVVTENEVFIFFFIDTFRSFSASGGCPQVLAASLSTESAPKMIICFLPGQQENISAAGLQSGKYRIITTQRL